MSEMTTQPAFLPGGCFPPAKPFNFDPSTGLPIEYDANGPYCPIVFITAPELPEGVASYDPYTGTPLDEHGHPVRGESNPWGQHEFTTRLGDRAGVDPAGHVIAQRPVYDEHTGLRIHYDEHGNGLVPLIDVVPPPGVVGYDPRTGEPLDEHGHVVEGVENPHRLPEYDAVSGLPITYDEHGNPHVPSVVVVHPDGVHGYDPYTGEPRDEHGNPVEGAENPNQRPEDRTYPEDEHGLPNFDPHTGFPLEYDEHGNPHPAVDLGYTPQLPDGVAGYDPDTGVPVDAHGEPVEGVTNPHGGHTFTTRLDDREGVDPSGHVIEQRPMYDDESGLPVYYDDHGTPYVFNVDVERPEGVYDYDPRTGDPRDEFGNVVDGVENPYQRPNFDTSTGRPITYDSNGYQVPAQTQIYFPPTPGVVSYDPRNGDPLDEHGDRVDGATNPWIVEEEPIFVLQDGAVHDALDPIPFVPSDGAEAEVTDTRTPDGMGEPGDVFGTAERPDTTTDPTTDGTAETGEDTEDGTPGDGTPDVTVPEQRTTGDEDPFAHTDRPDTPAEETTDASTDDDVAPLRDTEPTPVTTETHEDAPPHETVADTADTVADVPDHADEVVAG